MPNIQDVCAIRLEKAKAQVHTAYIAAITSLGGAALWAEDDKAVLDIIDERLRTASKAAAETINAKWQRHV